MLIQPGRWTCRGARRRRMSPMRHDARGSARPLQALRDSRVPRVRIPRLDASARGDRKGAPRTAQARAGRAPPPVSRVVPSGATRPAFPTLGLMAKTEERPELWGGETTKAVVNFPVSGEPIPVPVARWLGRIKGAAARANADLGLLDGDKAERISAAAARIAEGELDDQFPIDVFQTGSGTSSNMNANEVIATLAGEDVHPNDDVNMGQSSNDVFPSAVHLAALHEITNDLLPAMEKLASSLEAKAR